MQTALYFNQKRFTEKEFSKEKDLENLMFNNCKCLFGQSSILIEAKKKIDNKALGGTIPDAFLFDLKDPDNPEFYLIEVELAKHSFYNHIFPQITKFFAFFKNPESQSELIEKLYSLISADAELKKEFKARIGNKEIFKYIKDTIENSQNILLLLDNDKKQLSEIIANTNERISSANSELSKNIELHTKEFSNNTSELISNAEKKIEELKTSSNDLIANQANEASQVIKYIEETNTKTQALIDVISNHDIPNSLKLLLQKLDEHGKQNKTIKNLLLILLSIVGIGSIGALVLLMKFL